MTNTPPEALLEPGLALQFKAAAPAALGAPALAVNEPEGIVTAIVSVTGVVDDVQDLIEPGAYTKTLTKRRPKVIRHHTWSEQVGRVLSIRELKPGDAGLPTQTKDGAPWPKDAGALIADLQYNLATEKGRQAFEDVRFYAESKEAEFSVGYQVPPGGATRRPDGVRRIREMDLYEISDVLFGAAPLSMALSVKTAGGGEEDEQEIAAMHEAAAGGIDWDEVRDAVALDGDLPDEVQDAVILDGPDEADTADEPAGVDEPADGELTAEQANVAAASTDLTGGGAAIAETQTTPHESKAKFTAGQRAEAADTGRALPDGSYPIANAADLKNAIQALGRAKDTARAKRHIIKRARALGLTDQLPDGWNATETKSASLAEPKPGRAAQAAAGHGAEMARRDAAEASFDAQLDDELDRRAYTDAMLDAVEDAEALRGAQIEEKSRRAAWETVWGEQRAAERDRRRDWHAAQPVHETKAVLYGGVDPQVEHAYWPGHDGLGCDTCDAGVSAAVHGESPEVKAALGWTEELAWTDGPADSLAGLQVKAGAPKVADTPQEQAAVARLKEWYVHGGGAAKIRWGQKGDFSRCVRIAGKHMRPDQAKGFCNLRHKDALGYYPATHAKMDRAKHGKSAEDATETKLAAWEPGAEVGDKAAHVDPEVKHTNGELHGTYEERREKVRAAATEALRGEQDESGRWEWDSVYVLGTWPDRVVVQRENYNDTVARETFSMRYVMGRDGSVALGEPEPVTLEVSVEPVAGSAALSGMVEDTAYAAKAWAGALEVKEGRVLSQINLTRLRQAVTQLITVLEAAGVPVDKPSEKQIRDEKQPGKEPPVPPDTTSDGARETKSAAAEATISQAEIAAGLALIGGAL